MEIDFLVVRGGREFIFSLCRKFIKSFYDYAASHRPFQSQVCSWMWVESFIDFRVVRRRKIVLYARKCTKSSSIPRRGPLPTSVAIGFACGDSTIGAELRLNSAVVLLVRAKSQQRDAYTMFRCLIGVACLIELEIFVTT